MVVRACNPSYSGGWGRRIAWNQEAEVAVSRERAIALQPGEQERNSVSKKKKSTLITFFKTPTWRSGYQSPWIQKSEFNFWLPKNLITNSLPVDQKSYK